MNDEELLLKYKKYVKKRNLIIIISLLFICFLSIGIIFYLSKQPKEIPKTNDLIVEKEDKAPVLELVETEITIQVNNEIDYMFYVKSAIDEVDGDLKEKVQYSKIDTSKTGEYKILYYVFDSSNNVSQVFLKVKIEEQEKEEPETKEEIIVTPPKVENNNSSSTKKEETKPSQNTTTPSAKPSIKYFLFKDGYTINNVVEACAKELKSYGGAGRCEPITDENGIYLGMKLEYE